MFTSRAEFRILLRQDNADERLTPLGYDLGLASQERLDRMHQKYEHTADLIKFIKETSILPEEANPIIEAKGGSPLSQSMKMDNVVKRPEIRLNDLKGLKSFDKYFEENSFDEEAWQQAEIQIKYEGYIKKEEDNASKLNRLEYVKIPEDFDYMSVQSISMEGRQKLQKIKPATIAQASRISGVSPSDVSILLIHLGR